MKISRNSSAVWNAVWNDPNLAPRDNLVLESERATIRWQKIKAQLLAEFGSLRGKRVLEIGSGLGTYAALLAGEGARVTLLDYSQAGLDCARTFFKNNGLRAEYVLADALQPSPPHIDAAFDIAISVGLTEHFKGKQRKQIHAKHFSVLKKGGIAVIIVPNKYNVPYRIYKWVSELLQTWKFGEEYPYDKSELLHIAEEVPCKVLSIFGDNAYSSLRFVLPANFLRRAFGVGFPRNLAEIHQQKATIFDDCCGYSLTFMAKKV